MSLAEIVAEGKAMLRPDWQGPKGYRDVFMAEHFGTLLAVAEAAVEMRENAGATLQLEDRSGYHARRAPRLLGDVQRFFMAFDAAARGKRT